MIYKVNDILYTRDGRDYPNITIAIVTFIKDKRKYQYTYITDVGEVKTIIHYNPRVGFTEFYSTPGKATPSHPYYDAVNRFPELFI